MTPWRRRLALPGWVLLPLRLFLGVTFTYAGVQKLADRHFFDAKAASSIQAQLHAYSRGSPIGGLVGMATHLPIAAGLLVIVLELAAGIGVLLGLWPRAAAVIGLALSLTFWLAVSWHDYPYFLGPDIVFLVAWTPVLLAGAGDVLSLDSVLRARARKEMRLAPAGPVVIEFGVVRKLCGEFDGGRCQVRDGRPCDPAPCPVLADQRPLRPHVAEDLDRRTFLKQATMAAAAGGAAVVLSGAAAAVARATGGPASSVASGSSATPAAQTAAGPASPAAPSAAPPTTAPAPGSSAAAQPAPTVLPQGKPVLAASRVPVGGAASFLDPSTGDPAFAVQPTAGRYAAFSAICTHRGCQVEYAAGQRAFVCPCHGAVFNAATGAVEQGPASRPLPTIPMTLGSDGRLYR